MEHDDSPSKLASRPGMSVKRHPCRDCFIGCADDEDIDAHSGIRPFSDVLPAGADDAGSVIDGRMATVRDACPTRESRRSDIQPCAAQPKSLRPTAGFVDALRPGSAAGRAPTARDLLEGVLA
jgi:hypothetical protein